MDIHRLEALAHTLAANLGMIIDQFEYTENVIFIRYEGCNFFVVQPVDDAFVQTLVNVDPPGEPMYQ